MKIKIDENLPGEIAEDLRAAGLQVDTVAEGGLAGASDAAILDRVQRDDRVLFTMDKVIADVRVYPPDQYAGIVLFRPRSTGLRSVRAFVRQYLPHLK